MLELSVGQRKSAARQGIMPLLGATYVGTAGWSIPPILGAAFPGSGSHLERYSRVLSCAEINATFYRSPRPTTYVKWAAAVPNTFRFSVKAPRTLTHEAGLDCSARQVEEFVDGVRVLGDHLGPILFQLPPKLAFDRVRAERFFASLRQIYSDSAVVEPRHASWFEREADSLLEELQITRAVADPAVTPAAMLPGGHRELIYLRLHGSPRTYYSSYTRDFRERIAAMLLDSGSYRSAWCIFDNTASGAAAANALELLKDLSE